VGGHGPQPQNQGGSRGRESRQQVQAQPRSHPQPQARGGFRGRASQPQTQAQTRGNYRQPQTQARTRGNYTQPQAGPPAGRIQPERRSMPRGSVGPSGGSGNRPSVGRQYDNRSQSYGGSQQRRYDAPRYPSPRSSGPSYGYRGGYYGNRSYGSRSYAIPYGYRPHGYLPGWSFNLYFGRAYGDYGGGAGYGYYAIAPGFAYGSVRIVDAPPDAQVFVDGYYAGVVDDYDGVFQHLNLVPGSHRIEIQLADYAPIGFDVFVEPGQTITYRANIY
jgi:hypothetical protein